MTKIGKLWTGGVAYVSLLVGAGLSVAGNLADTYRTRGLSVDTLDKVMAAGWPILVLLAIEMFVSPRWSPERMFQVWRWLGCLAVGGMAMVVSWTHLHDLMHSRGQLFIVSVLGPFAIDGMAVMATGLILSTRTRVARRTGGQGLKLFTDIADAAQMSVDIADGIEAAAQMSTDAFRDSTDRLLALPDFTMSADMSADMSVDPMATRPDGDLSAWTAGYEQALDELSADIGDEAEAYVRAATEDILPQRTRTSVPEEFAAIAGTWDMYEPMSRADMIKMSAAYFEVHPRTVRRWLFALRPGADQT